MAHLEEQTIPISWTQKHQDFWFVNEGGPKSRGEKILEENRALLTLLWNMRREGLESQHAFLKKIISRKMNGGDGGHQPCFGAHSPRQSGPMSRSSGCVLPLSSARAVARRTQILPLCILDNKEAENNAKPQMLKLSLSVSSVDYARNIIRFQ